MSTTLKVKLHHKNEPKSHLAVYVYDSDKVKVDEIANNLGLSTSNLLRTLVNNLLDGTVKVGL